MNTKYKVYSGTSWGAAFLFGFLWFTGLLNVPNWMSFLLGYGIIWFCLYVAYILGTPEEK